MKPSLLIADFTGVYAEEGFLQKLQERGVPYRRVRLGDIEGTTCYCDPDAEAEISRRLVPEPGERMRWIDSGDYHFVTKILAAREQSPFTLVLVDNHPDDQAPAFGGVLSCGSWVRDLPVHRQGCPGPGMVPDGLEPGDLFPGATEGLAGRPAEAGHRGGGPMRRTCSRKGGNAGGPSD